MTSWFRDDVGGFLRLARVPIAEVSPDLSATDLFENLAELEMMPVTIGRHASITADNAKQHSVGSIGRIEQVGNRMYARVLICDERAINLYKEGAKLELCYQKTPSGALKGRYLAIVVDTAPSTPGKQTPPSDPHNAFAPRRLTAADFARIASNPFGRR